MTKTNITNRSNIVCHPIPFSTEMVQAILSGRKTQTRRIVKPQPDDDGLWNDTDFPRSVQSTLKGWNGTVLETGESKEWKFPYGQVGDVLWVRESFYKTTVKGLNEYFYKADVEKLGWKFKWKPPMFMPKKACRLFLKITKIRCERLQDITFNESIDEGILPLEKSFSQNEQLYFDYSKPQIVKEGLPPFWSFNSLWCSIYGSQNWEENPFVWVIHFKRVDRPVNFTNH